MSPTPALWQMTAGELSASLARGEVRSVELVEALQARADQVEPLIHGFAWQLREEALRAAAHADAERAAGRARGPLHGLPLTVKENIDLQGLPTTLGLEAHRHRIALEDAVLVRLARDAGMVILGKSNVPQGLVSGMECSNPLYGETRNPFSLAHGPGGSSGGEAALIATGASLLGLGTDLGGSIRSPAAFCGIVGLKPSTHRWSNRGVRPFLDGQEIIKAQIGPLARTVADLVLLCGALPGPLHARLDADVPPLPFPVSLGSEVSGLRIGWFDDDGFLTPAASIRRAVRETTAALSSLGAQLVPLPPTSQQEVLALYVAAVSSDGLRTALSQLRGDRVADTMVELWWAAHVPEPLRRAGARVLSRLGERRLGALIMASGRRTVEGYWGLARSRQALKAAEIARWNEAQVDAVLCPASATPPVPLGASRGLAAAFSYTARYNLLGFPAGVVPVTRARAGELHRVVLGDRLDRLSAKVEAQSLGLPIAVQVIGRPYREDQVLTVMAAIEGWARLREDHPHTPVTPSDHRLG